MQVKRDLKSIAAGLSSKASYSDAMYQLYVRMKVAHGLKDVAAGRVVSHEQIKKHFVK